MKSNYKRIGDYIREVKVLNKDLSVTDLRGINIDKYFMPSVANTIGTDMSKYKVVKNGQFACNRMHVGRDKRLPISLHKEDKSIIVSPAYTVFEVIDESVLNSEYLMMWFSRKEFDREAWFYTDSDVRGGLGLNDLFNIKIPIPSIEKQRKVVDEYNLIINRITINKEKINILEEICENLFREYLINNKDVNYLQYNEFEKIPDNWKIKSLSDIADYLNGLAMQKYIPKNENDMLPVLKIKELRNGMTDLDSDRCSNDIGDEYKVNDGDVIFSWSGSLLVDIWCGGKCGLNQHLFKVTSDKYPKWFYYLWTKYHLDEFKKIAAGKATTMGHIKREELKKALVLVPSKNELEIMDGLFDKLVKSIIISKRGIKKLIEFKEILLLNLFSMGE